MIKKLITVSIVLLLFAGCSKVNMSAGYARQTEKTEIEVTELNRRCQEGDNIACKEGLALAADTLRLIVNGLHGISEVDPNESN